MEDAQSWGEFHTVTNSTEQEVAECLEILNELGTELQMSTNALREAADIFGKASIENLPNGRSARLIVAAAICTGSREVSEPRPTGRVAELAGVDSNRLNQATRLLQRSLQEISTVSSPEGYFPYLRHELELSQQSEERARRLFDRYEQGVTLDGKNPVGIAGALLYAAADQETTQREIADIAGITQETIRVRVKELRETMSG